MSLDPYDSLDLSFYRDVSFCHDQPGPEDPDDCPLRFEHQLDLSNQIVRGWLLDDMQNGDGSGNAGGSVYALYTTPVVSLGNGITAVAVNGGNIAFELFDQDGNSMGVFRFAGDTAPPSSLTSTSLGIFDNSTDSWTFWQQDII